MERKLYTTINVDIPTRNLLKEVSRKSRIPMAKIVARLIMENFGPDREDDENENRTSDLRAEIDSPR